MMQEPLPEDTEQMVCGSVITVPAPTVGYQAQVTNAGLIRINSVPTGAVPGAELCIYSELFTMCTMCTLVLLSLLVLFLYFS